jgi:hypothetical protein
MGPEGVLDDHADAGLEGEAPDHRDQIIARPPGLGSHRPPGARHLGAKTRLRNAALLDGGFQEIQVKRVGVEEQVLAEVLLPPASNVSCTTVLVVVFELATAEVDAHVRLVEPHSATVRRLCCSLLGRRRTAVPNTVGRAFSCKRTRCG